MGVTGRAVLPPRGVHRCRESMRRFRTPIVIASVSLTLACYEYRPVGDTVTLQAHEVELTLTDSGAVVLASRIGPGVEAIQGIYLGDSAGAHLVAVSTARARTGQEVDWRSEHVSIPHALVATVLERRFSRSRTAFAGALAAIGIGGMTSALRGRGESNTGIPTTPPPVNK